MPLEAFSKNFGMFQYSKNSGSFRTKPCFIQLKWLACEYSCLIPAQYWEYFGEKHVSAFLSLKIPKCLQLVVHSFSYYEWQTNDETSPRTNL